jgi:hypothetical protein
VSQAGDDRVGEDGAGRLVDGEQTVGNRVGVVAEERVEGAGAGLDGEASDVVADAVEGDPGHRAHDGDDVGPPGNGGRDVEAHEDRHAERAEIGVVAREEGHRAFEREGLAERADVAEGSVVVPLELAVVRERGDRVRVVADREEHSVVFVDAPQRGNRRGRDDR